MEMLSDIQRQMIKVKNNSKKLSLVRQKGILNILILILSILDEHDTMWTDYQHQHIADCMRQIPEAFKNFAKEKRHKTSSEKATIKDLSKMMQGKSRLHIIFNAYALFSNASISERNSNVLESHAYH